MNEGQIFDLILPSTCYTIISHLSLDWIHKNFKYLLHLLIWTEILGPDLSIPGLLVARTRGIVVLSGRLLLHCGRLSLLPAARHLLSSAGGRHHLPVLQAVGGLEKVHKIG